MFRNIVRVIFISVMLSACVTNPQYTKLATNNSPINLIPMYGYPEVKKTERQKESDKKFIDAVVKNSGSNRKSSEEFAAWGWDDRRKGNLDNAMRRFNQSWLLDNTYYQPYWGFGAILLSHKKPSEAAVHFERALQLVDDLNEKPRLLVDAARANAWQASIVQGEDEKQAAVFYKKANGLIEEALTLNPEYEKALLLGALIYYDQGDYENSWRIVKMAKSVNRYKYSQEFIKNLSSKMPELK